MQYALLQLQCNADTFAKFKAGTASDRKRAHSAVAQTDAAAAYQKHDEHHNAMSQYTKETLEKWFTKTNLSRTKTNTKKFRALDRSVMKQVEQVRSVACPETFQCDVVGGA
eukprot:gene14149-31057_t